VNRSHFRAVLVATSIGTTGASADADLLARSREHVLNALGESETLGRSRLRNEIEQLLFECSRPGWDGFESLPVTSRARDNALALLSLLPLDHVTPEIVPDPDGMVRFEWQSDPRHSLSVSIGSDARLHYAALLGDELAHGSMQMRDSFPRVLTDIIRRITAA
jgi:hypothetical protein